MELYGVKPLVDRAKELFQKDDECQLKYACLELRFCFELIAYRQLQQYGEKIPGSIVGQWKPDQIIRLLASFDPASEQGGILSVGLQNSPDEMPTAWATVGESKAIPWRTFRRHYQTLGSYLHAPMPKADGSAPKPINRDKLRVMIADIEDVMSATIILAMHKTINATCDCGQEIFIGESEYEDGELARCSNKKCGRYWHKATLADGDRVLQAAKTIFFKCQCDALMSVPVEDVWKRFSCRNCMSTFRVNLGYSEVKKMI
ncbi:hypothetical protein [Pseudomonas sp. TR47]|uniref:hypothetical protein n=1 Tax=Pseudomonas sp. TR47 TaxID=3342639 RepID=UPI00376FAB73